MRALTSRPRLSSIVGATLAVLVATAPPTSAGTTDCATDWANFSGANGFIADYTYLGDLIRDHENSSDPSNGGTGVAPTSIDLASASPGNDPGPESTVLFGYYDGGTVYDVNDPITMQDDYILFTWRLQGDPKASGGGNFDFVSRHWNVLLDLDADGYKEYWIDLDGSFSASEDVVNILYDNTNRQDIADPAAARVERFAASTAALSDATCTAAGSPGRSHTRRFSAVSVNPSDTSGDWFLQVQVPMTAFVDGAGNQVMFPDSPVAFVYSTSASNTDPLQKDFMMDIDFLSLNDPITFGDVVTPSGYPSIQFVDASLNSTKFYGLNDDVYIYLTDRFANSDSQSIECVTVVVTNPRTGDDETVTLCETGKATGVFTNRPVVQSSGNPPASLPSCDPGISTDSNPPEAWLNGIATSSNTVTEKWTMTIATAGNPDQWTIVGSVSGTQTAQATSGTAFTTDTPALTPARLAFTLYQIAQNSPANGSTLTVCTIAGDPLATADQAGGGTDNDGTLDVQGGDEITVAYTSSQGITVSDTAAILNQCDSLIQFTRANGLESNDFQLAAASADSDKLYVTVTHFGANANPALAETITIDLSGQLGGGLDSQTSFVLTETGVNTGVFRNATGLDTQIYDGVATANDSLWEDIDAGIITAQYDYSCDPGTGTQPYSATDQAELFAISGGGRVYFTNGAGTQDVDIYTADQPVFIKVTDETVTCGTSPAGTVDVTIVSDVGDSEQIRLYETASGSGVYMNRRNGLSTSAGSAVVTTSGNFVTEGAVAGGTFVVATGPDVGQYGIVTVDSTTQITLDATLTTTRTGDVSYDPDPLLTQTYDGAFTSDDGILEAIHEDSLVVSYEDCSDGDGVSSNNVKTDTAAYNAPQILINRVLFYPDPTTCQTELVELLNVSGSNVTATGYRIADEDLQLNYTIPNFQGSPLVLQPGEKLILSIGLSNTDLRTGTDPYTYYLFTPASAATYPSTDLDGDPGQNDGDQVSLYDTLGDVVDYVGWSDTIAPPPSTDFLGDDSPAVLRNIWPDDSYRVVETLPVGFDIHRTVDGFDTNKAADWDFGAVADTTCEDVAAATRVVIQGLRVDRSGLVELVTSSQRNTRELNLFVTPDPHGRSGLRQINDEPVLATLPSTMAPQFYGVRTQAIDEPFLVVEEIETSGHRRMMGPFEIDDPELALSYTRQVEGREARKRAARETAGRAGKRAGGRAPATVLGVPVRDRGPSGPPAFAPGRNSGALKIEVSQAGTVQVPLADLEAWGLPRPGHKAAGLRLTRHGQPVAMHVVGTVNRAFEFEALEFSTDLTDSDVYVLSWGNFRPPSPSVPFTELGPARSGFFHRAEQDVYYAAFVSPQADPWVWDFLIASFPGAPLAFDLPGLAARASVPVRVAVSGATGHGHVLEAFVNGTRIGEARFFGTGAAVIEGSVPAGVLLASGNQLTFTYSVDSGPDPWGLAFVDFLEVGARVSVPSTLVGADRIAPYEPDMATGGADYLVVTHADFMDQAQRIAGLKAAEGLRTAVVDVERAYDRYSSGVAEPEAVRALIREYATGGSLRYVLLVGDDTNDPRDIQGFGEVSYVPSLQAHDGQFGWVPSENRTADLDGDGRPDVAIGRLPARTTAQADRMADKIAAQESLLQAEGPTHVVANDNRIAGDMPFKAKADLAVALFPAGATITRADVTTGITGARAALVGALKNGVAMAHWFGHGGFGIWADEQILNASQVATLANSGHGSLVFTWACEVGSYTSSFGPTINERLLDVQDGGAVAVFGPAGITSPQLQAGLYDRVYQHLFAGERLGDAIRHAKAEALAADVELRPIVEGFNLLGDPSLAVPADVLAPPSP